MKKISISQYNELYNLAENSLQTSWRDLGLSPSEVIARSNKNKELVKMSKKENNLNPVYFLYKKNANEVVDQILKALNIQVEE